MPRSQQILLCTQHLQINDSDRASTRIKKDGHSIWTTATTYHDDGISFKRIDVLPLYHKQEGVIKLE